MSDLASGMSLEDRQRILGLGTADQRAERLRQQLAYGQALRSRPAGRYSTTGGAIAGGVADLTNSLLGAYQQRKATEGLEALDKERTAARGTFLSGVTAADQQGKQQEAGALLSQRPFVPFATDYNAESLAMRDNTAQAGAAQRLGDARSLAVLSGDPALKQWAMMQEGGSGNDELQRLRIGQRDRALQLALDAEERKKKGQERELTLKEEQAKQQREDKERAAAVKKVADALNLEEGLRKEVTGSPVFKDYVTSAVGFDKVQRAADNPTAPNDLALIFGYMKVLDPSSVVKETEFANAQNAAGVPDRIRNIWNKAKTGERLTPEQRAEFIASARSQFGAQESAFKRHVEFYRGVAGRAGANVENVLPLSLGGARPATTSPTPARPAPVAPAPASPPVSDDVRIRLPDGSEKLIPPDKVEEATRDFGAVVL